MKHKLTIIRGLPGSGKSTYAKKNYNCLILENDMFHIKSGEYCYSRDKMPEAISWCDSICENALSLGMDVVVANTFIKKNFVDSYRKLADKYDADFEVIRCVADFGNVHDVPKFVLEDMKNGFEDYDGEIVVNN